MKQTLFLFVTSILFGTLSGQSVKPTNVYPSNLEENQYFESYDATTQTIKGIYFAVLSDGDNSLDRTPAFTVKLYLYQNGKDPIFIKTYELKRGIKHLTRKDFKNENVSLQGLGIPAGEYRLGIYVNADKSFEENYDDNANLFRDPIILDKSTTNKPGGIYDMTKKKKDEDEEGNEDDFFNDDEDDEDDDDEFFNDDEEDEDDDEF